MTCEQQTRMVCDRCGHVEVISGYASDNQDWVTLNIKTYKRWLFPRDGISCCGQNIMQTKLVCKSCSMSFINWMRPGRLNEVLFALDGIMKTLAAEGPVTRADLVTLRNETLKKLRELIEG